MNWSELFPKDSFVIAIPSWKNPRLLLLSSSIFQRWRDSDLFPAWRFGAKVRRFLFRIIAMLGISKRKQINSSDWLIRDFVKDVLPNVYGVVILASQRYFLRKFVAQIKDNRGYIIGYLKYGESDISKKRLENEYLILKQLPNNLGPKPLKIDNFKGGMALLISSISGKLIHRNGFPKYDILDFINKMPTFEEFPFLEHPYVKKLKSLNEPDLEKWFTPFLTRNWVVTIQHGDFAPWNIIRTKDGKLQAIDWEYGTLKGIKYLDITYYVLAVALLIKRYNKEKTINFAMEYLTRFTPLSKEQARSMIAISAFEQYKKSREDGLNSNTREQKIRLEIWKTV